MAVAVGDTIPEFSLVDQNRERVESESLKGRKGLIVFIPNPFTGVCTSEACEIQENIEGLNGVDADVTMITTHGMFTNKAWADQHGVDYPILSDYWPHGEVSRAFGNFHEKLGIATRATYVYDEEGVIRDIITSDDLGVARPYSDYISALEQV